VLYRSDGPCLPTGDVGELAELEGGDKTQYGQDSVDRFSEDAALYGRSFTDRSRLA
jgi:hypothetical protein